jgi:hypothetical protein
MMGVPLFGGRGEVNHAVFDPWSLVHALVGIVMARLGAGLLPTLALAVGWEVAEHVLKNLVPALFPHPSQDSLANSAGDVLATVVAWAIATLVAARLQRRARAAAGASTRSLTAREVLGWRWRFVR